MKNSEKSKRTEEPLSITGTTKVCGIIADPVEHSMSPVLQNLYGISTGQDMVYVPFRVPKEGLESAVRGAFALNIQGLNVTVPHKQSVMEYLDRVDEAAAAVGAVNTLVRTERGYKGYNTDVPGLGMAVKEAGIEIRDRQCILIGAGGAAKAAAFLLAREGAKRIYILNRSKDRAEAVAQCIGDWTGNRELAEAFSISEWRNIPAGKYLAVQTTSVGMYPDTDRTPVEDREFYDLVEEAVDVIYTPEETKFMRCVREAGGRAVNGLNMLIYQGVLSYELWNPGLKVDSGTVRLAGKIIEERLGQKQAHNRKERPVSVILTGFMGAGKTSVGKILSQRLGLPFLDTDSEIEKRTGMTISEIFRTRGEEEFRKLETEILKTLISEAEEGRRPAVISTGGGLPVREENRKLLKKLGICVYLKTSLEKVLARLQGDTSRPLLAGENAAEKAGELLSQREPCYMEAADFSVCTDRLAPEEIAEEILKLI